MKRREISEFIYLYACMYNFAKNNVKIKISLLKGRRIHTCDIK